MAVVVTKGGGGGYLLLAARNITGISGGNYYWHSQAETLLVLAGVTITGISGGKCGGHNQEIYRPRPRQPYGKRGGPEQHRRYIQAL